MSQNVNKICNNDTSTKANNFLKLITNFEFIVSLVIARSVLDRTLPVTKLLQTKTADILDGIHLISSLKTLGNVMRTEVDFYHNLWYKEALSLASSVNVHEAGPRICVRQSHRPNAPADNTSDYFKRSITIPFLDHLNNELQQRFDTSNIVAYQGLAIIPSKIIASVNKDSQQLNWQKKFLSFASFYKDDMPNYIAIPGELDLWKQYWVTFKGSVPNNVSETLKLLSFPGFENIKVSLRILATLPVTSCECERSFSALRRLKNYNRSTMKNERLNGLALMHVHKDIQPDIQEVINKFAKQHPRRLEFL